MEEAGAKEVTEETVNDVIVFGHTEIKKNVGVPEDPQYPGRKIRATGYSVPVVDLSS